MNVPNVSFNNLCFAMKYFLLIILFTSSLLTFAQRAIPPHGGVWVHDDANVLSPATKSELEAMLKYHRDSTSNQIAVLVIPSLDGDDIDDYAVRVFTEWKLGQEKKDNGVLFLIAMQDKKMRIEVGYGLEGTLTDALSSRINRNEVSPYFRTGDYESGVKAGVVAIIKAIQGTYVNEDPPTTRRKGKRSPFGSIIIIIIIIALMARRKGGGGGGGGYWSAAMLGGLLGNSMGRSSGSWDSGGGSDFGGGGFSGGGGSSDSW
jgi:uncharacterized protein